MNNVGESERTSQKSLTAEGRGSVYYLDRGGDADRLLSIATD